MKRAIGKWGLHETSHDYGIRATEFATNNNNNNKIIRGYILATHNIRKGTLQSPATRTNNQVDRVLVDGRHASSITM